MTTPLALVLNAGSSSLKFALYDIAAAPVERARGIVERIGGAPRLKAAFRADLPSVARDLASEAVHDHAGALGAVLFLIEASFPDARIVTVGHRVVHGGTTYAAPIVVTPEVLAELTRLIPFAPIHQPHNVSGIEAAQAAFPDALQVACFDTAFHRTQPWVNDTYALPPDYYARGVRRYGFHGLSYEYVSGELARIAPERAAGRVVIAHLGNGASMCAVEGGRSISSTMGFTPLDGLPMGTRCGQIDPGVIFYMLAEEERPIDDVQTLLYTESGLLGLSGLSNDMRTLEASGTAEADAAIAYYTARIREQVGRLAATLGGLDALVFTAGIGENSPRIRAEVCERLGWIGIELDPERNAASAEVITTSASPVEVRVVPTDEEIVIVRAAKSLWEAGDAACRPFPPDRRLSDTKV
ncbi:acetate kinase [Amaricoccus macauensis]|uniref:Acetate kinase n=1 Tax=Amaricoccus macauensis TaxID=57001 RepID=A0A840SXH5_9RHOB|nr:acetate/propionate family kinase [Amaricoccus macauensis]MBB5223782.1 acetate kinase [Amaricoccus macauensis]